MINDQDIIIDNIYPEIAQRLNDMIDNEISVIVSEEGISPNLMIRILDTWSLGISARVEKFTAKNAEQLIKEHNNKELNDARKEETKHYFVNEKPKI
jgi:hypothetical protein